MMRVARYYNNRDIRLEEYPRPSIGPGEILVRVAASGICGTDVMEWYRIRQGPRILGHEITGEIVESKSKQHAVGERVFVSHHVPCNACKYCLAGHHTACETLHKGNYDPGGYSEFVRLPKINVERGVYALPDHVSYEEGTLIEPLACVIRAQRVIGIAEGQTVLILGSGVSGLLNIQCAKLKRAKVIATDINAYRLAKAKAYGADEAILANQDLDIKAERVIVCAGSSEALKQAFRCVDRKGIILLFAIPNEDIRLPTVECWRNEITITSSYGAAPEDLKEALELIAQGTISVKETITHILPLTDIQEGFRLVAEAKESLKVVITPTT
jgi:L-iditol 2-dehydrogenase